MKRADFYQHSVRSSVLVLTALLAMTNGGCGKVANDNNAGELKPGDPLYPVETTNPMHVVSFVSSGFELSDFGFYAHYETDRKVCTWHAGLGVDLPYELGFPINLIREGATYRGLFAIDRFQAGRCGWKFTAISDANRTTLGQFTERQGIAAATTPRIDMWCYATASPPSGSTTRKCEALGSLRWPNADRRASPQFLSTFSQQQQSDDGTVGITMATQELTVDFHDLNSVPGALIPVGDRAEQSRAAQEFRDAYLASPEAKVEPCFQKALGAYIHSNPESATLPAGASIDELKNKCRVDVGLAPMTPKF